MQPALTAVAARFQPSRDRNCSDLVLADGDDPHSGAADTAGLGLEQSDRPSGAKHLSISGELTRETVGFVQIEVEVGENGIVCVAAWPRSRRNRAEVDHGASAPRLLDVVVADVG